MPGRQRLLGLWLLANGIFLFGGAFLALWLEAELGPSGPAHVWLWFICLAPGLLTLLIGAWLERRLFAPLRHFRVQLTRLVANPGARDDYPPEGWLSNLGEDLQRLRDGWRSDRQALKTAHAEGARTAARIRQELETLLQSLQVPLLLCDRHRRLLLFNHAAETLFAGHSTLGLGRNLTMLLPSTSLWETLNTLPADGSPREVLIPFGERWLRGSLRRVMSGHGETLLSLEDATASWRRELTERAQLAELLPALRRHAASLTTAAEALEQAYQEPTLRQKLETAIQEESQALGTTIEGLGRLVDSLTVQGERLSPTWSNDLWHALAMRLETSQLSLTPIGIPAWFKADVPALQPLLHTLLEHLAEVSGCRHFEGEICLGNRRVYLDLIWPGIPLGQQRLNAWSEQPLDELPMAPRIADILRQHDSDLWSLTDDDGQHARLRLPLPAAARVGTPATPPPPRPEFHDFDIAELPAPDGELANRTLRQLDIVVFDTETTGLELADGDTVISIGACRIVNGRLLADDTFDQLVDPQRSIPPQSTVFHGLTDADVVGAPPLRQVLPRFHDYADDAVLMAHNAAFDLRAIHPLGSGLRFNNTVLDTLLLSRALDASFEDHDLDSLAERFDLAVPPGARHSALGDARITGALWLALLPRLEAQGITTLAQALALQGKVGVPS
ncbi:exonuclease domain-containing protein [Halomonas sp. GXIMD04776]|uniref:3'-5' exonuclease n=1 Tax=Halomonas sp. GXIMD04776 TaxID=3415605 RepID=UPI003C9F2804